MKTNTVFDSKYLTAADLNGQDVTVTISAAELIELDSKGRGKERKILLSFAGKQKHMICNKTNCRTVEKLYGDETDNWIGQRITIGPREVQDPKGEMIWALRVSLLKPVTIPRQSALPQPPRTAPRQPEPGPAQAQEGRLPDAGEDCPF